MKGALILVPVVLAFLWIQPCHSACTATGRFADTTSVNCTGYMRCVMLSTGVYAQYNYLCPNSAFDPAVSTCSTTYICPTITTTVPVVVTPPACTAAGRFPNTSVTGCVSYVMCIMSTTGTYMQYVYTCPIGYVFDPNAKQCSLTYTCPPTTG